MNGEKIISDLKIVIRGFAQSFSFTIFLKCWNNFKPKDLKIKQFFNPKISVHAILRELKMNFLLY